MILVEAKDGGRVEIQLDAARGDGIGLQVLPEGFVEPIPLASLTGLALEQHPANPVVTATFGGRFQTPYSVNPESVVHVGVPGPGHADRCESRAFGVVHDLRARRSDGRP